MDLAVAHHQRGRLDQAVVLYREVLQSSPRHFDALHLCAVIAAQRGDPASALGMFDRALKIESGNAAALNNRGMALRDLGRLEEALADFDRAARIRPDLLDALVNRGNVLRDLKRLEAAVADYDRVLRAQPGHVLAHFNRGNALQDLGRHEEALASYDSAIEAQPDFADALNNRGNALRDLRRSDEALESFRRALAIRPDFAGALHNYANALQDMKRSAEALECYDHAISLEPGFAQAHYNRGNALVELKRLGEALESYDRALELDPGHEYLHGIRMHIRMRMCEWANFEGDVAELEDKLARGEKASNPFPILSLSGSAQCQRQAATVWAREKFAQWRALPGIRPRERHGRIRVGYFSADFRDHPVAQLTADMFERHDRSRFQVTAFSLGPDSDDPVGCRVRAAVEEFIDVRTLSDGQVALLAREREIDIAIDLGGYTEGARAGIFALRAAPVQVNFLGYPGTSGAPWMEYLLADAMIIPQDARPWYSEKIAYLPSYQPNDSKRAFPLNAVTRAESGLPETGFVFCCFNNNYKITPSVFESWMRILRAVDGSVLWIAGMDAGAMENLRAEAVRRDVAAGRLVFAARVPQMEDHLARLRLADLFLDTQPYNAHTTASDALWSGVPLLTCPGETFASRVAASVLLAAGLPECVAPTLEAYESEAVGLAMDPERLGRLRRKVDQNRLTARLFDTGRYVSAIEDIYSQMYARYLAGLAPDHLFANPSVNA
jgi:predicted O-linked N-acetylglucosamine transferase (SPINDLY family)